MKKNGERAPETGLSVLVNNPESVKPRIAGLIEQITVDQLCTIEARHEGGKDVAWRISKGSAQRDGYDLYVAERTATTRHGRRDLEVIVSAPMLIANRNTREVIAYVQQGELMNTDSRNLSSYDDPSLFEQTEAVLREILMSSRQQATFEAQARARRRNNLVRGLGKTTVGLGLAAAIAWRGPDMVRGAADGINTWNKQEAAERAEARARHAAEDKAQAEARAARIAAFDRSHPRFTGNSVELKDNIANVVPFTEEFDGIDVPAEGRLASRNIRSVTLPAEGKCVTVNMVIPEEGVLSAARTGQPSHFIFVEPSSVNDTLKVCDRRLNPDPTAAKDEDGEPITPPRGKLFLQLNQPPAK